MGAKKGETLNPCLEHEKAIDKFVVAVEKEGQIVGHLSKSEPGRFTKTRSYFIRANHGNACKIEVSEKRVNLGDGEGLQILCNLRFSGGENYLPVSA